jgi:periplasmic protein TonB
MNSLSVYDELDHAIEQLIAQPAELDPGADLDLNLHPADLRPGLAELVEVARDLRQLPRADFKSRLKVELEWQAAGRSISSAEELPVAAETHSQQEDLDALPTLFGRGNGLYPVRGVNLAASVALHAALLLFAGLGVVMVKSTVAVPDSRAASVTWIDPHVYDVGYKPNHGGGGGGDADKMKASQGEPVRFAHDQLAPPTIEPSPSQLQVEATLIGPPDVNLVKNNAGDALSILTAPSAGTGVRGGIGSNDGGGVGEGYGPGRGPGWNGGEGGGIYLPGNGVTAPRAIFSPEPEYSDEARMAKYQGVVTLLAIVGADGRPRQLHVARSLGMGLDEKAIAAVETWRFEPGRKNGRPVAVQIVVEVDFHLF